MHNLQRFFKIPTDEDFKTLWDNCLFVFDTNVFSNSYRLPVQSREDFFKILQSEFIEPRIWIPFQVALEITHNSVGWVREQKETFTKVRAILEKEKKEIQKAYSEKVSALHDLSLNKRHTLLKEEDLIKNTESIKAASEEIDKYIQSLNILSQSQQNFYEEDLIKKELFSLFDSKIGEPFSKEIMDSIYAEGETRYTKKVPPGYKDEKKEKEEPNFYAYDGREFKRKFGDLLIWKELIKKCQDSKVEYMMFVTNDEKEDWWNIIDGKKMGLRYEMLNEIYSQAPELKMFHIYTLQSFLTHVNRYSNLEIRSELISETKDITDTTKELESQKSQITKKEISTYLWNVKNKFPSLQMTVETTWGRNHLRIRNTRLNDIFMAAFDIVTYNVVDHRVFVRVKKNTGGISISFNYSIYDRDILNEKFAAKRHHLRRLMRPIGTVSISHNTKEFHIVLLFPTERTA